MASAIGWLDHAEQQRQQVLEAVDLFHEKGTLDEARLALGVRTVRHQDVWPSRASGPAR